MGSWPRIPLRRAQGDNGPPLSIGPVSVSKVFQQSREDSLGHPPDDRIIEPVGRELPALAPDLEPDRVVGVGMEEKIERDPPRGRDFGVERELRQAVEGEDVGTDGDRWERRGPGHHVVEAADQVLGPEHQPHLFGCLADGGSHQVGLGRALAAARKRHVSGPGITGPLGAPDQKNRVRVGSEYDRDRGPDERIAPLVHLSAVDGEAIAKPREPGGQWLWVWQPPPQHPPPGGGPSRLRSARFPPEAGRAGSDMSRSSLRPLHSGQATLVSDRTSWSNSA